MGTATVAGYITLLSPSCSKKATHVVAVCGWLQVNPLAEDDRGRLIAADAKLGFDDSAGYRQKEIFALKDESQLDPR